jgi:hypothetical protein
MPRSLATLAALRPVRPPAMEARQWDMPVLRVPEAMDGASNPPTPNGLNPAPGRTSTMDLAVISRRRRTENPKELRNEWEDDLINGDASVVIWDIHTSEHPCFSCLFSFLSAYLGVLFFFPLLSTFVVV